MAKNHDFLKILLAVDEELINEGIKPFQRPFHAYTKIMRRFRLGNGGFFNDPVYKDIQRFYGEMYREVNLNAPPLYQGAFMFGDIFFPLRIPVIFGDVTVNLVEFLGDISDAQKDWLFSDEKANLIFLDQAIDLMDFVYGLNDVETGQLPPKTLEMWHLARKQLEAAASIVLGAFDKDAVIQNCCIAIELLLKGSLIAKGFSEKALKDRNKYGHNFENLVNETAKLLPTIDQEAMLLIVRQLPDYVESRYKAGTFSRKELGNFLMSAQFAGGEILRQFSERDFRSDNSDTNNGVDFSCRTFPKKREA